MKTRVITLRFKVPAWFPNKRYWRRVHMTFKYVMHHLRPFICHDCGKKIDYKFPDIQYRAPGKNRVMLQLSSREEWSGRKSRLGVCGSCTAHRIHGLFSRISSKTPDTPYDVTSTTVQKCDCCGETKDTIGISFDKACDIRFGSQWWNGHHMCEQCLTDAAEHGDQSSTFGEYFSGDHHYQLNSDGVVVGLQHWWSLLIDKKETT